MSLFIAFSFAAIIASGTASIPTTFLAFLAINKAIVPVPVYKSYTISLLLKSLTSRTILYNSYA